MASSTSRSISTKKALLFGYFPVGFRDASNTPGTLVFTCLSHDIIAHETTHAPGRQLFFDYTIILS